MHPSPTLLTPGTLPGRSPLRRKRDGSDLAFFFFMGSLAAGLLYFIGLTFFI
ncbi:MAG: hypothetical protein R3247_03380 [Rhodothermales bacterium]|nr:hypothetical protein [Rhodothermales bacterium]